MVLNDVLAYLDALIGRPAGQAGVDLFGGSMPDGVVGLSTVPDLCTAIEEYGGLPDDVGFGSPDVKYESPRVQVMTRGNKNDRESARTRAEAVRRKLAQMPLPAVINGVQFYIVKILQPPFWLRRDERQRDYFTFNVEFYKDPAPEA
jgi:hypothetical protein